MEHLINVLLAMVMQLAHWAYWKTVLFSSRSYIATDPNHALRHHLWLIWRNALWVGHYLTGS